MKTGREAQLAHLQRLADELISRGFTVTTSAGTQLTAYARNTYSWNQFDTRELTVRLAAGENTIAFGNPVAYAPDIEKITVAPALLP